jgi:antirestriction protein
MSDKPIQGETYRLRHSRLGRATVRVLQVNGEWIDCLIVKGKLSGMVDDWNVGDVKTVRDIHSTFTKENP